MENLTLKRHTCPCCGYEGLGQAAYAALPPFPAQWRGLAPPYQEHFGLPSYEVCPCCGFEYGFDDNPGTSRPVSFEEYLSLWVADGGKWFDQSKKPQGWELTRQLVAAGLVD